MQTQFIQTAAQAVLRGRPELSCLSLREKNVVKSETTPSVSTCASNTWRACQTLSGLAQIESIDLFSEVKNSADVV